MVKLSLDSSAVQSAKWVQEILASDALVSIENASAWILAILPKGTWSWRVPLSGKGVVQ